MNLYILRHGIAVEKGTPGYANDTARPLTPQGKKKMRRIAKAMKKRLKLSFDIILSSPLVRTKQTAEIVASVFKAEEKLKFSDSLKPTGSQKRLIEFLTREHPPLENILLVGHEPYLSGLISVLLTGNQNLAIDFKKGGLCKLEIESLSYDRCATLAWLLTPKQMELMG